MKLFLIICAIFLPQFVEIDSAVIISRSKQFSPVILSTYQKHCLRERNLFLIIGLYDVLYFIVPGDGGSQLDARLNKTDVPHFFCTKTADWYNLWLNMELLVPEVIGIIHETLKFCKKMIL